MNTDVKTKLYYVGLVRAFAFEASHQLPEYIGKCAHLHGHSYHGSIQVTADPANADKSGIVMDFGYMKQAIEACVMKYDHKHLNDFFLCPTAELMVIKIAQDFADFFSADSFQGEFGGRAEVARVELYETANCGAVYPALPAHNLYMPASRYYEGSLEKVSRPAIPFAAEPRWIPKE